MAISFTCPCGKAFIAKDEHAGQGGICPACRREFVVPMPYELNLAVPQSFEQIEVEYHHRARLPNRERAAWRPPQPTPREKPSSSAPVAAAEGTTEKRRLRS